MVAKQTVVREATSKSTEKTSLAEPHIRTCMKKITEFSVIKPIRAIVAPAGKYNTLIQSFTIPGELLSAASRGDVSAGLTLFKGIANCYPVSLNEEKLNVFEPPAQCAAISKDMYRNRFALLESLAKTGDVAAQTMYALQGSAVANMQLRSKDPFEVEQGRHLMGKVKQFAHSSAREGSKDSIIFLIGAYQNGLFGPAEPAKSYPYLIAMNKNFPTEVPSAMLKSVEISLAPSDIITARAIAFDCPDETLRSSLANPFVN